MDMRKPRDRIWRNMLNAKRLSLYYSRRTQQLEKRHKLITFSIALIPVIAIALLQLEWEFKYVAAAALLFVAAVVEVAVIHFGSGGDVKAAKIMANQTTEIAYQWSQLWIDQNRDDIMRWIEMLERATQTITTESISHQKRKGENHLDTQCAEDAKHELTLLFGR